MAMRRAPAASSVADGAGAGGGGVGCGGAGHGFGSQCEGGTSAQAPWNAAASAAPAALRNRLRLVGLDNSRDHVCIYLFSRRIGLDSIVPLLIGMDSFLGLTRRLGLLAQV